MIFFHKLRRKSSRRNSNSRRVSIETLETRDLLSAVLPDDPIDDPVAVCPFLPHELCLPGDADMDGQVSFSDFLILSDNFGMSDADQEDGDFNGDGTVDFDDFLILADEFGT